MNKMQNQRKKLSLKVGGDRIDILSNSGFSLLSRRQEHKKYTIFTDINQIYIFPDFLQPSFDIFEHIFHLPDLFSAIF